MALNVRVQADQPRQVHWRYFHQVLRVGRPNRAAHELTLREQASWCSRRSPPSSTSSGDVAAVVRVEVVEPGGRGDPALGAVVARVAVAHDRPERVDGRGLARSAAGELAEGDEEAVAPDAGHRPGFGGRAVVADHVAGVVEGGRGAAGRAGWGHETGDRYNAWADVTLGGLQDRGDQEGGGPAGRAERYDAGHGYACSSGGVDDRRDEAEAVVVRPSRSGSRGDEKRCRVGIAVPVLPVHPEEGIPCRSSAKRRGDCSPPQRVGRGSTCRMVTPVRRRSRGSAATGLTPATWDIDRGLARRPAARRGRRLPERRRSAGRGPLAGRAGHARGHGPPGAPQLPQVPGSAEVIQALDSQVVAGRPAPSSSSRAPVVQIPVELEKLFVVLDHDLPGRDQLEAIARGVATEPGSCPRARP